MTMNIGVLRGRWGALRTGARALGCVAACVLAGSAILAYLGVNLMFGSESVGQYWAGGCASIPVMLFVVAAIRNGLRFTIGWSAGLLLLAFLSFVAYGMDAGLLSFLMAGLVACVWMGVLVFWALAYRPSEGAVGQLMAGAGNAFARVRSGAGGKGGAPGVSLMTGLLLCNLFVSLMGVLV